MRVHIWFLMRVLTTIREVNYRYSRKRWFFHDHPGSRHTPLRLYKSREVDTANRRCIAPLPTAAVIRLSRIASALSRICNIPVQVIISLTSKNIAAHSRKKPVHLDIVLNRIELALTILYLVD